MPSVIPSILGGKKEEESPSSMPKILNKFRQKKLVRPLNLSYEYTQYLLKNISEMGALKPEVINFGLNNKKKELSPQKNRSTISEL